MRCIGYLLLLPAVIAVNRGGSSNYEATIAELTGRRLKANKPTAPPPKTNTGAMAKGTIPAMKAPVFFAPVPIAPVSPPVKPTRAPKPSAPTVPKPVASVTPPTSRPVAPVTPPTAKPVAPTSAPVASTTNPVAPTTPVTTPVNPPTATPVKPTAAPAAPVPAPVPATAKPTGTPTKAPLSAVAQKIAKYAPGGVNAFVPGSYQACALKYVESRSNVASLSDAKAVQYYALACIYCATYKVANPATNNVAPGVTPNGWLKTTNWLSPTADPCNSAQAWFGVACDTNGKVLTIQLASNNLSGGIPAEIALLASDHPSGAGNLNILDLYNNQFLFNAGDVGLGWIGGLGPNMQQLFFGSTAFYYTNGVPDFLSKLTNLQQFDCSYTYFTGPLRSAPFATLKQLTYIELDGNGYNSTIPSVFGTLPKLERFYAANAFVSGGLDFMKGMPSIYELWVDKNSIKGTLPTFLGTLSTLGSFSVTKNQLSGSFPTEMNNLVNMDQMYYYTNKLSGAFPNYLTGLTVMRVFKFEDNNISGDGSALCSALGPPFGALTTLGTDCSGKTSFSTACSVSCCSLSACGDA